MNIRPTEAPISLIARSPQLAQDAVEAVITLPTFKRPAQLLETLASLKAQATARRYARARRRRRRCSSMATCPAC